MIGALFVEKEGVYKIEGIEVWDKEKDARLYRGPWPIIAHPPCERWGRYWSGGPSAKVRKTKGDDNGCFKFALEAVRIYGGVLEHPEGSHAFKEFGLPIPNFHGGWTPKDAFGGSSCCISQKNYGHRACKMTWLYAVGSPLPELVWGARKGERLDEGFHSAQERREKRALGQKPIPRLSVKENIWTPIEFRDLLIKMVTGFQPVKEK